MKQEKNQKEQSSSGCNETGLAVPDRLNDAIGVLTRREVEVRILMPVIDAFSKEFGEEKVIAVLQETIIRIARDQGAQISEAMGGDSLSHFADSLEAWTRDNALEIDAIEKTDKKFSFNVTRCRYAELYRNLGIPRLGSMLSCGRDFALIEGFNKDINLSRTQTLMEGAPCCDFRYTLIKQKRP